MRIVNCAPVAGGWRYHLVDDEAFTDADGNFVAGDVYVFVAASEVQGKGPDERMAAIAAARDFDPTDGIRDVSLRDWQEARAKGDLAPIRSGKVKPGKGAGASGKD